MVDAIRKTAALALALTALLAVVFTASAAALPAKFWGAVPQSTLTEAQFKRLGRGGVASIRIPISWADLQPQEGGTIDWSGVDANVERAALAGIDVLPTITGAPTWAVAAAKVPGGGGAKAPSRLPASGGSVVVWKSLLTQAVERYGPGGKFWTSHLALPETPVRTWQIWNEPNFKFFVAHPNPTEYGKLVKISSAALKAVDPGAKVVLAGLFSQPKGGRHMEVVHGKRKLVGGTNVNYFASYFLEQMYKTTPGVKSRFNGVALHPYTGTYQYLTPEIEEVRETLKQAHDPAKGLWITELGWSSGPPKSDGSNSFAKGPAGQVKQLKGAFSLLSRKQAGWRIQRVYWFSVDDAKGVCNFCDGSGLFGPGFVPKKSWYAYVKFAGGTP
jgi:polysaccharide biosynthesis protein PslG